MFLRIMAVLLGAAFLAMGIRNVIVGELATRDIGFFSLGTAFLVYGIGGHNLLAKVLPGFASADKGKK